MSRKKPTPKPARKPRQKRLQPGGKYDVRLFRHVMVPLTDEAGVPRYATPFLPVLNACDLCPARCCHHAVKVSLPDAVDFCRTLGLPFFAALTIVQSRLQRSFVVEPDPRFLPEGQEWIGRAEISLIRKPDGACSNLIDLGGHLRCAVYAARPSTCRLYPVSWTSDVAQGGPMLIGCPVPFAVTPSREEMFRAEIERSIDRWALHDRVLEEWHAPSFDGQRTVDAFLSFAIPRTAELLGVSPEGILVNTPLTERLHQAMIAAKVIRPITPGPRSPGTSG